MGYKIQEIYIGSQKVRPNVNPVLFDFGDWTDSQWTTGPDSGAIQGTITKTSSYISFYNGNNNSQNYLSQYPIDGTKDFLLEFNANIPTTNQSYHFVGLITFQATGPMGIGTNWEQYSKVCFYANGKNYTGENFPGTADYFIKKEGNVLTMGWGGVTKYTDNNYSFASEYYLQEHVYKNTLTINTAKLTYL